MQPNRVNLGASAGLAPDWFGLVDKTTRTRAWTHRWPSSAPAVCHFVTSSDAGLYFATRLLYCGMEAVRKPPEYVLEIFADAASVKEMVKGSYANFTGMLKQVL